MKTKLNFKNIITVTMILISITTANAQFNFGVKAGANCSTQSALGDVCDNSDYRVGLSIGGLALYKFSDNLATQIEINYEQKGKKVKDIISSEDNNLNNKREYITIPLLLRGTTQINENNTKFYGEVGPYYGFMTNNSKITSDVFTSEERYYSNDFGAVLGMGIIKPVKKINLIIGLRYEMGLSRVYKMNNDLRNKTLSLNLGILF
jgi:hypothetical protein